MDENKYTRCVNIVVNEEDYAHLYNYIVKHQDEDPILKRWINKDCDPFIQGFIKVRLSTEEEKRENYGKYVIKPIR